MLYPFNYGNKFRIFELFSLFGHSNQLYELNHFRLTRPQKHAPLKSYAIYLNKQHPESQDIKASLHTKSYTEKLKAIAHSPYSEILCRDGFYFITYFIPCFLIMSSSFRVPCIQICPLNRRPGCGSPKRSLLLMQTTNSRSWLSIFIR